MQLDFGLLIALASGIAATLFDPKSLTFIQLRTNLQELVLFETGVNAMRRERNTARSRRKSVQLAPV